MGYIIRYVLTWLLVIAIAIFGLITFADISFPFIHTVSAAELEDLQVDLGGNYLSKTIEQEILKEEEIRTSQAREEKLADLIRREESKIAYLTFDDGPSYKVTPAVLDILAEYNIKATFFVVGNMVDENPTMLKRIYDEGHEIGNHSYGHNYGYLYASADNFMADIYKAEEAIRNVVGQDFDSKVIRFPGGSFEASKNPMKKAAKEAGYASFDWNALNGDAEGHNMPKSYLLNRLKQTTGGQKELIVLMHDTDAKWTTVEYLRDGIEFLISQGYEFDILNKDM